MNKFLLTLAAAALCSSASFAAEVTLTPADKLGNATIDVTEWTPNDLFKFTFDKNGGSTAPAYNKAGDIRLYAKNTCEITAPENVIIDKVVFNISTAGLKRLGEVTANTGSIANQAVGDATVTWTGSAYEITFTVDPDGKKAVYGSDGDSKAAQLDFDSVVISYTETAATKASANLKFSADAVSVALDEEFNAPVLTKDTTAPVTYTSSNTDVATVNEDGVVTIVAAGTTIISADAAANDDYYAGSASYTLTVIPAGLIYNNACTNSDCGFTAYLQEGDVNPWTIDATYGLKASGYISGVTNESNAVMGSPVIDLTNYENITLNFESAVNQFKLNNEMIDFSQENLNKYIDIVIAVVENETEAPVWDELTFINADVFEGKFSWTYKENGPISLNDYAGKKVRIGFHYASTEELAGTWEIKNVAVAGDKKTTAVNTVETADEAPVYYDLNGVKVNNPANGLFIKVIGNKSSKVILK